VAGDSSLGLGTLHCGIKDFGSTSDLYGPKINMKLVNSSSQPLSYVEFGEKW
jgi:hypothetical protein